MKKKLLVTILTSNDINLLEKAVNSVLNQYKCELEYDVKIVVNTLQKNYFDVYSTEEQILFYF